MIDRIAKLLNKAERAATPEEAQLYFDKAQALATAHAISLAKARLHAPEHVRVQPINTTVRIGEARRHINRHLVLLMSGVARANDLKMDIAHNSTYVILYGFPSDIAQAEELWSRIATQMVRFGEAFLASDQWRHERKVDQRGRYGPMTRQTARAAYYTGFIDTVSNRIASARAEAIRTQERRDRPKGAPADSPAPAAGGTAIALRAKEVAVQDFYAGTSSARGSWRGSSLSTGGYSPSAFTAGRRDGTRVALTDRGEVGGRRQAVGQ